MQRDTELRNLFVKRSAIMSSIEMYMLREFDKPLPEYAKNFYSPEDLHRRSAFLQILAKQQLLRKTQNKSTVFNQTLIRLRDKYQYWTDRELSELQALYADLIRQIQPYVFHVGSKDGSNDIDDNDDDDDDDVSSNITVYLKNIMVDASTGNNTFDLLSEAYAVALRLL